MSAAEGQTASTSDSTSPTYDYYLPGARVVEVSWTSRGSLGFGELRGDKERRHDELGDRGNRGTKETGS